VEQLSRGQSTPRARGGFTLIELMITLTVLGTGLLAMLVLQTQALKDGARGKHATGAAMVARDQLERIQNTPFSDPDLQPDDWKTPPWLDDPAPDLNDGEVAVRVSQPGGQVIEKTYTVWYRVAAGPAGSPELRFVDLEVVWDETEISNNRPTRTGRPTVALSTILVNNDK
jgi:prepilin-type N-terminal cleavage/methylation domain-containing protein